MVVEVFSDIKRVIVYSAWMLEMGLVEVLVLVLVYSENIMEEVMVCESQYSAQRVCSGSGQYGVV